MLQIVLPLFALLGPCLFPGPWSGYYHLDFQLFYSLCSAYGLWTTAGHQLIRLRAFQSSSGPLGPCDLCNSTVLPALLVNYCCLLLAISTSHPTPTPTPLATACWRDIFKATVSSAFWYLVNKDLQNPSWTQVSCQHKDLSSSWPPQLPRNPIGLAESLQGRVFTLSGVMGGEILFSGLRWEGELKAAEMLTILPREGSYKETRQLWMFSFLFSYDLIYVED